MSSVEKNSVVSFHAEKKLLKYYQKVDSVKAGVSVSNPVNQTENKEDLKKLLDKIYNNQNSSSNNTAKDVWTDIGAIIEGEKKKLESKVDTSPPVNPVAEEPVQAKPNVKLSDEVQKKIVDAPVTIHSGSDNPLNIGSGVIVADTKDNNGKTYVYVLSNYHVEEGVEPGKQTFVGFKQEDGSIKQLPAELVASRDKFNNEDLVMYRVEVRDGTDYTVTEIAKKEAEVGDILYSSGFPGVNQKSFLTPKHTDNVDVIASENKNIPNKPELHPKLSVPSNIVLDDKRTDVIVIDGDQNGTGEIIQVVSKLEVLDSSENLDIRVILYY